MLLARLRSPCGAAAPAAAAAAAAKSRCCCAPVSRPTQHILGAGSLDDNLSAQRGHAHIHAGVAVLSELAGQQLVQLRIEHTIGHELHARRSRHINALTSPNSEPLTLLLSRGATPPNHATTVLLRAQTHLSLLVNCGCHGVWLPLLTQKQKERADQVVGIKNTPCANKM